MERTTGDQMIEERQSGRMTVLSLGYEGKISLKEMIGFETVRYELQWTLPLVCEPLGCVKMAGGTMTRDACRMQYQSMMAAMRSNDDDHQFAWMMIVSGRIVRTNSFLKSIRSMVAIGFG